MRTHRLVILFLVVVGCKATSTSSTSEVYREDLSVHRSKMPVSTKQNEQPKTNVDQAYTPLTGHIQLELDSISKISYAQNKAGRYVDGYVIQVYSGTSRESANEAQAKMQELFPELSSKVSYRQPNFRVKGGKFLDRLEANRVYNQVKEEFSRALLVPERLLISYE